jgi:hypothetical protein
MHTQIDGQALPQQCRQFLTAPAGDPRVWSQRLSLAECEQDAIAAPPATSDPARLRELVTYLENAMLPSSTIYRDAMATAPHRSGCSPRSASA